MVPHQDVHISTPQVGKVVSFSYEGNLRRDIPFRPTVFRVRSDLSWDDVIQSSLSQGNEGKDKTRREKRGRLEKEKNFFFLYVACHMIYCRTILSVLSRLRVLRVKRRKLRITCETRNPH